MTGSIALLQEQLAAARERQARAVDRVRAIRIKLHSEMREAGMATPNTTHAVMRALKDLGEVTSTDVQPYCDATRNAISAAMAALVRRGKLVRVRRGVYARAKAGRMAA